MKVRDEYGKSKFEAVRSLIVYRNKQGQTLCTLNAVKDGKVLPGEAVDGGKLAGLFRMIGTIADPADSMKMVWQDPRILAIGANSILWYAAPHRAEIFFSCLTKALMRCSGKKFPYPGLVFLARKNTLRVFAVKSRPNLKTPLYHAPLWNISNGAVCLPWGVRNDESHSIDEWEKIFFTSAFSHPGLTDKVSRTRYEKLVPALIRSKARKFPSGELIPANITIQNLIEEKQKP